MKITTVDQRMEELKAELPSLSKTEIKAIKAWLIKDRNEVTLAKVRKNFNSFNNLAKF